MSTQPTPRLTPQEYLEQERKAEIKSEYLGGEILAMSGGTRQHNLIAAHVLGELDAQLRGRDCEAYGSDMRVRVSAAGLYAYPDVSAGCGELSFEDDRQDVLLNPSLLVEVLSDSTEAYDRGEKSEHYRRLESLQEYLLIAQKKRQVEHYARQSDGQWLLSEANCPEAVVELPSITCRLRLSDIYARIRFEPQER